MAEEKDKIKDNFQGHRDWIKEQWEQLKAEEDFEYHIVDGQRIKIQLTPEEKSPEIISTEKSQNMIWYEEQEKLAIERFNKELAKMNWVVGTDPYRKEPGTSKFYLMDEAGAWPIVDPKEFEEARGLNWEQIPKGKYKTLTREELYPNGKMESWPTKKNFMDKIIARLETRPPWWVFLIPLAAFLGMAYIVLKYFSLG